MEGGPSGRARIAQRAASFGGGLQVDIARQVHGGVRDAIAKVGPTGGVLAGVWRNDNASIVRPPGLSTTGMMSTTSMPGWAVCAPVPSRNPGEDAIVLYVSAPLMDPSRAIDPATARARLGMP